MYLLLLHCCPHSGEKQGGLKISLSFFFSYRDSLNMTYSEMTYCHVKGLYNDVITLGLSTEQINKKNDHKLLALDFIDVIRYE
jgi:hypothetical protein